MKLFTKVALVVATSAAFATAAQAANFGALSTGNAYVGVKAGQYLVDVDGLSDDTPTAYGAYAGYNFDQNFGVEAEYVRSGDADLVSGYAEYNLQHAGLYGTYRYQFNNTPIYAKAKLGFANAKIEVTDLTTNSSDSESDSGLAGGVALGYKPVQNVGVELAFDYIAQDVNAVTLGAHFAF